MLNFCVSLTSIPSRFDTIYKTIKSLNKQTKKANKIFLNIPNKYKRYPMQDFDIAKIGNAYENLEITRCEDFGPGTKLLGSFDKIFKYDYIILVDDDHVYSKEMLNFFYEKGLENLDKAYSFCVYNIEDCKIGQGADGFMINTKFLKNILGFYSKNIKDNPKLFFNDDLWISIFINKVLRKDIENLSCLLKKSFFRRTNSIYKKHTKIDALIEQYSSNRKKARSLRFVENCEEYLHLKNSTKNFTDL